LKKYPIVKLEITSMLFAPFTALIGIQIGYLTYDGVITINWERLHAFLTSVASTDVSSFSTLNQ